MGKWFRNDRWERYAPVEPPTRHVWVRWPGQDPMAGLVVSWRAQPDGSWLAQVAVSVADQLRLTWVAAEHLAPAADAQPPRFSE